MTQTEQNRIMEIGDPFVLLHEGVYYLYGTTKSYQEGYHVYTSKDLEYWEDQGFCLKKGDVAGEERFWAPELLVKDGKFYMIYTSSMHIGVAVSDSPLGPFCQEVKQFCNENDKEIDGHFLMDDDGQVYLYFVRQEEKYGNSLWGAKMKEDMTGYDTSTARMLMHTMEGTWEKMDHSTLEGPFVVKHKGKYYLSYSANDTSHPNYAIGYAVSESPLGEFVRYENNPILKGNGEIISPGHHSFTTTKDGKELICVYHTHNSKGQVNPRILRVGKARFVENPAGNDILEIDGVELGRNGKEQEK